MDVDSTWSFTQNFKVSLLCVLFLTLVKGQSLVAGPSQPIVAVIGDDVVLPCYLVPPRDVTDLTVEWSRPDLKANPNPTDGLKRKYVYLYRDGREMTAMKNPLYFGRTALPRDGLTNGNASLRLTNVTLSDDGSYRCFIPKLNSQMKEHVVRIVIVEAQPTTTSNDMRTEAPRSTLNPQHRNNDLPGVRSAERSAVRSAVFGSVSVLIVLIIMGFIYMLHKRKHQQPNPKVAGENSRMVESSSKQTDAAFEENHLTSSSLDSTC